MIRGLKKRIESNRLLGIVLRPIVDMYNYYRCHIMNEKKYIEIQYKKSFGYNIDIDNPKTLNEKIQWLKLYDRTELHTKCADKVEVRKYVENIIGREYLVPNYLVINNVDSLSPTSLPDSPFIIKTSHDSGSYKIIYNKNDVNWNEIKVFFKKKLNQNYYWKSKEWQYKNIKPRLIFEKLLQTSTGEIPEDYKLHCFEGKVKYIQVDFDRGKVTHTRNWYDINWNRAEFYWSSYVGNTETLPNTFEVKPPAQLHALIELSELLAKNFIYVRVDFYIVDEHIYFGELTFHHDSGLRPIIPTIWDKKLGDLINLSKLRNTI